MPTGALIGSAVVGAGASVYGSSKANKAANKAADANKAAADASTAEASRQYDQTRADYAPWRTAGQGALSQLMTQYGISAPAASGPAAGAPSAPAAQAGSPDWRAYIEANPDLKAAIRDPNGGFEGSTDEQKAANHYERYGKEAGWQVPVVSAPTPAAPTTPAAPAATQPNGMPTQVEGAGPALPARQDYARPAGQAAPAAYSPATSSTPGAGYSPTTQAPPSYTRPEYAPTLDLSLDAFEASPEAKAAAYEIGKQSGATASALAASGASKSGAALKELQRIGEDGRVRFYGDFAGRTTNQFNTDRARTDNNYAFDTNLDSGNKLAYTQLGQNDRQFGANLNQNDRQFGANLDRQDYQYGQNRADNIFETDRAYGTDVYNIDRDYLTGRTDRRTGDLFTLAGMGTTANAASANAGQGYSNILSNNLFSTAAAQGKASQQVAANTNQAVGNILGMGSSLAQYYANSPSANKSIGVNSSTVAYTPEAALTPYRPSNIMM